MLDPTLPTNELTPVPWSSVMSGTRSHPVQVQVLCLGIDLSAVG